MRETRSSLITTRYVGNHQESKMAVIAPDYASSRKFLSNLAELDQILQQQSTRVYLDRLIDEEFNQDGNESVRRLQAARYEIFVMPSTRPHVHLII